MTETNGNNVKDWVIRSVTFLLSLCKIEEGHSETERMLVNDEGLALLSLLKIQSGPYGNIGESHWEMR